METEREGDGERDIKKRNVGSHCVSVFWGFYFVASYRQRQSFIHDVHRLGCTKCCMYGSTAIDPGRDGQQPDHHHPGQSPKKPRFYGGRWGNTKTTTTCGWWSMDWCRVNEAESYRERARELFDGDLGKSEKILNIKNKSLAQEIQFIDVRTRSNSNWRSFHVAISYT